MCGIAGMVFYSNPSACVDSHQLQAMCDALVHRGPDDEGLFVAGPVGLAMRRLSIIDLKGGRQPMQSDDGSVTIVYNGEIYNYRELRRSLERKGYRFRTASDTESILHAYQEYGPECLPHLNGMFALAIWDQGRRRLFLARDRLGIKPLYICQDARQLRFASELKALDAGGRIPRELDEDAVSYFFRYGYVAAPGTLFKAVRKLPPAHYLVADANGVRIHRYWSVQYDEGGGEPESHYAEAVYETLKRSVGRQLISDVPLGAFLSGGLDSGSIVSLMSEVTGSAVSTYSIGFSDQHAFHDELADARFVSEQFRTQHHEIVVEPDVASLLPRLVHHLDEPLADSSFIVTYLVSTLARETVKVILSGVGGDELFGGYRRYLAPRLGRHYDTIPACVRSLLKGAAAQLPVDRGSWFKNYFRLGRSFLLTHHLPSYEQYDHAVRLLSEPLWRRLSPRLASRPSPLCEARRAYFDQVPTVDPVTRMMHLDLNTSLPESLLLLTDKMTMAASIEARVPFLDHELVELAARIPGSVKIPGLRLRSIQKQSMAGRLPARVLTKKKRGFGCPVGSWFRADLKDLVGDTLSPARLKRRGLFDAETAESIRAAHAEFREDYHDLLLALLTFELWQDQWMGAA